MSTVTRSRIPTYRHHKPTGQAVVTFDGRDIYLGRHNSPASRLEYNRLIGEWIAGGRRLPAAASGATDLTVSEMLVRYWRFAQRYYRKNGEPTKELDNIRQAVRPLKSLYGHTAVREFGPRSLKSLQAKMIDAKLSRKLINQRIGIIKSVVKWAVSEEQAPPSLSHALSAVMGLPIYNGNPATAVSERTYCGPVQFFGPVQLGDGDAINVESSPPVPMPNR